MSIIETHVPSTTEQIESWYEFLRQIPPVIHRLNSKWWCDPVTGLDIRENPYCFSNKLALIHSEISEALEGDRKSLYDTHLPQFEMRGVELADALIRILDLAAAYDIDIAQIMIEKLKYNMRREDHKVENRLGANGKVY
jgi:NTP pyrophosphatase (non-canonical NTP hydrolase)